MTLLPTVLVVLAMVSFPVSALPKPKQHYDGNKVFEIMIKAEKDLKHILSLHDNYDLDIWHMPRKINDSLHVHVASDKIESFLSEIEHMNPNINVWVQDVQKLIDDVSAMNTRSRRAANHHKNLSPMTQPIYRTVQEILEYVHSTAGNHGNSPGVITTYHEIGQSHYGNPLSLIEISTDGLRTKPVVFIDGGIHAREWIAPATVLAFIEKLTQNPANDPDVDTLLATYDFHIIPLLNPDGYSYSWTAYRLWRKNRNPNSGSTCVGVDLNRNFPFQWAPEIGGSTDPCQDTYSGETGGSELETQALMGWLQKLNGRTAVYLTFHAYGQFLLYPWGYTHAYPADRDDLEKAALAGADAVFRTFRKRYTVGSSTNVLYSAAGGSDDYAKGSAGFKYSYTLELRDTGRWAFVLPADQIVDAVAENWAGIKALLGYVTKTEGY